MDAKDAAEQARGPILKFFGRAAHLLGGHGLSQRITCVAIFVCFTLAYVLLLAPSTRTSEILYSGVPVQMQSVPDALVTDLMLRPGDEVEQRITGNGDVLNSVSVILSFDARSADGMYEMVLEDESGSEIARYAFTAQGHASPFAAELPVGDYRTRDGEQLRLTIRSDKENNELMQLSVVPFDADSSYEGLVRSGRPEDAVLLVSLGFTVDKGPAWALAGLLLLFVCPAMLCWRAPLAVNALIVLLIFGLFFVFVTPINDSPDEIAHMARTFHMVDGYWAGIPDGSQQAGEQSVLYAGNIGQNYSNTPLRNFTWRTKPELGQIGSNLTVLGYIPQAAGVALGRMLGLNLAVIYYMGRVANLLFYAVCAYFAIRMAPRFRLYMSVFAIMPMQVAISATYNSDGMLFGLGILAAGWFIRMYYDRTLLLRAKDLLLFMIPCVLIAIKQYWFAPIAFLPFVIPKERFARPRVKLWCILVAGGTAAATLIALQMAVTYSIAGTAGGYAAEDASVPGQIAFLAADPMRSARIIASSLANGLGDNLTQLFVFGRLTAQSPELVALVYVGFITVVAFSTTRYQYDPAFTVGNTPSRASTRIGVLVVCAVTIVAIYLATYLTWTPVGVNVVMGVQGRYLIPVLAFLPFLSFDCWPLVTRAVYMRSRLVTGLIAVLMLTISLLTLSFYAL